MHLRGIRAGLAQNLRVFLCMDLGIMRGVLLVVFAVGRLGCWWAGLLVGFLLASLPSILQLVLSYVMFYYIIFKSINRTCAKKITCVGACADLRFFACRGPVA